MKKYIYKGKLEALKSEMFASTIVPMDVEMHVRTYIVFNI